MSRTVRSAAAGLLALSTVGLAAATAPTASAATTAASCKVAWGSTDKALNLRSTVTGTAVADVRSGHHACYDRVVFELAGKAGPVAATYGGRTTAPAALGVASTTRLMPVGVKVGAAMPTGFTTIKGLVYAGRTSDGVDAVAVVTRARLPYRMFVLKGPNAHNRIVIDVAHRW